MANNPKRSAILSYSDVFTSDPTHPPDSRLVSIITSKDDLLAQSSNRSIATKSDQRKAKKAPKKSHSVENAIVSSSLSSDEAPASPKAVAKAPVKGPKRAERSRSAELAQKASKGKGGIGNRTPPRKLNKELKQERIFEDESEGSEPQEEAAPVSKKESKIPPPKNGSKTPPSKKGFKTPPLKKGSKPPEPKKGSKPPEPTKREPRDASRPPERRSSSGPPERRSSSGPPERRSESGPSERRSESRPPERRTSSRPSESRSESRPPERRAAVSGGPAVIPVKGSAAKAPSRSGSKSPVSRGASRTPVSGRSRTPVARKRSAEKPDPIVDIDEAKITTDDETSVSSTPPVVVAPVPITQKKRKVSFEKSATKKKPGSKPLGGLGPKPEKPIVSDDSKSEESESLVPIPGPAVAERPISISVVPSATSVTKIESPPPTEKAKKGSPPPTEKVKKGSPPPTEKVKKGSPKQKPKGVLVKLGKGKPSSTSVHKSRTSLKTPVKDHSSTKHRDKERSAPDKNAAKTKPLGVAIVRVTDSGTSESDADSKKTKSSSSKSVASKSSTAIHLGKDKHGHHKKKPLVAPTKPDVSSSKTRPVEHQKKELIGIRQIWRSVITKPPERKYPDGYYPYHSECCPYYAGPQPTGYPDGSSRNRFIEPQRPYPASAYGKPDPPPPRIRRISDYRLQAKWGPCHPTIAISTVAVLTLLLRVSPCVIFGVILLNPSEKPAEPEMKAIASDSYESKESVVPKYGPAILFVQAVLLIIACCLLFAAVIKEYPQLLLPYVVVQIIFLLIWLILSLVSIGTHLSPEDTDDTINGLILITGIGAVFDLWAMMTILTAYMDIKGYTSPWDEESPPPEPVMKPKPRDIVSQKYIYEDPLPPLRASRRRSREPTPAIYNTQYQTPWNFPAQQPRPKRDRTPKKESSMDKFWRDMKVEPQPDAGRSSTPASRQRKAASPGPSRYSPPKRSPSSRYSPPKRSPSSRYKTTNSPPPLVIKTRYAPPSDTAKSPPARRNVRS